MANEIQNLVFVCQLLSFVYGITNVFAWGKLADERFHVDKTGEIWKVCVSSILAMFVTKEVQTNWRKKINEYCISIFYFIFWNDSIKIPL